MAESPTAQSIIATRGAQMFPTLAESERTRLARFGEPRAHQTANGARANHCHFHRRSRRFMLFPVGTTPRLHSEDRKVLCAVP